jgi:RecA-family ATPase
MPARIQHIASVQTDRSGWTIDGTLSGLSLLWGGPGVGKTFVAISMAVSVATGRPWMGRRTRQGPVYYIVGEGGLGNVTHRIRAALSEWTEDDLEDHIPLFLIAPGMDFVRGAKEFADLVGLPDTLSVPPRLVIVDTLSRNFVGDENKQEDMGRFVNSLDQIRDAYGCDILVIHHANRQNDLRGSSVLFGAVDVSWALVKSQARTEGEKRLTMNADKLKERDAADATINLRALSTIMRDDKGFPLRDEFGDTETTLIVKPTKEDIERAKVLQECGLTYLSAHASLTYDHWNEMVASKNYKKSQFNGALTLILTYPGRWGIMRGIEVGTFVPAIKGVENVW